MRLDEAKQILKDAGYLLEGIHEKITPEKHELIRKIISHPCYDLDLMYVQLAEMDEDWLKNYLEELYDKEMRRACM